LSKGGGKDWFAEHGEENPGTVTQRPPSLTNEVSPWVKKIPLDYLNRGGGG